MILYGNLTIVKQIGEFTMKKKIMLVILWTALTTTLFACGSEGDVKGGEVVTNDVDVEVEEEINEDILAVAKANEQFNTDSIIERANNRMMTNPDFYADSKVPKIDSCVTGIVCDDALSKDGNYVYYFGKGEDAKNEEIYLSAVCAYAAHLRALGLTYELKQGEMSYIYDGDKAVASFMVFNTEEDGFMMIISPE